MLRDVNDNLTKDAIEFETRIDALVSKLIIEGRAKGFSFEEIFYEISTCTDMQVLRLRREERNKK